MTQDSAIERFIRSAFGSIWALELLLILRQRPDQDWPRAELIAALRASEQVLARSCADLNAAGLITERDDVVRYAPATPELEVAVAAVVKLYAARPAQVRRLIVGGPQDAVESFADAFRLRKD